jgi:hypothetical protein
MDRAVSLDMRRPPWYRRAIVHLITWLGLLALALVLLWGRYDWSEEARPYSWRGYLSSAYMLVLTLPTLYYLVRFYHPGRWLAVGLTGGVAVVLTLPYRWLGLDPGYRDPEALLTRSIVNVASNEQVHEAMATWWSMPFEVPFFMALVGLGVFTAGIYMWRSSREHLDLAQPLRKAALWLGLYAMILLQTWLHLGMRSPLNYLANSQYIGQPEKWWVVCLFPPHQGIVCWDYPNRRELERHFMGVPREINPDYTRRSYLFYLSSQLTYFFNPYYVFLILNIGLWLLACFCAYRLASWWWSAEVGAYCAFLVGTASGFIVFVADVASYLAGYALYMILLWVFESLIVRNENRGLGHWLLFGSILAVCSLVYDLFPLYIFFLGYAYLRRLPLRWLFLSLVLSLCVYAGYLVLQRHVPGVQHVWDTPQAEVPDSNPRRP